MADLGTSPPSNSYLEEKELQTPEKWYPLRVMVCEACWLVQTADFVDRGECFSSNYAYFSSCSQSWVDHARTYAASMIDQLRLGDSSLVVEIAANDGYLLRHFQSAGIPCYGVEPTESTAAAARNLGLHIVSEFFGLELARRLVSERGPASLVVANNVLAHVPDINDFAAGVAHLLAPGGVATFEFPHLMQLLAKNYFDTIYHEHFSYLSLHATQLIFAKAGLDVIHVEELSTHGGSLRVHATQSSEGRDRSAAVDDFLDREHEAGLISSVVYRQFARKVEKVRNDFVSLLLDLNRRGASVAAYGAAAKGNTLLNFAGVKSDLLHFVVDRSPGKVGRFLPGSRIPVVSEEVLQERRPEFVVILPWNLRDEVSSQLQYAREWGTKFVVALPELEIF